MNSGPQWARIARISLTTGDSGSGTLQRILFREFFIERLKIGNNLFLYYVLVKDGEYLTSGWQETLLELELGLYSITSLHLTML
jgi:hypothetical protein